MRAKYAAASIALAVINLPAIQKMSMDDRTEFYEDVRAIALPELKFSEKLRLVISFPITFVLGGVMGMLCMMIFFGVVPMEQLTVDSARMLEAQRRQELAVQRAVEVYEMEMGGDQYCSASSQ